MDNRSTTWIVWIVIIILVVLGIWYFATRGSTSVPTGGTSTTTSTSTSSTIATTTAATGVVKEFTVTGTDFKFSPATLTVKEGDTVKINVVNGNPSGGFPHDLVLNQFNVATNQLNPGQRQTVQFIANKAGTFEFYCSVDGHRDRGMVGSLIVQP